MTVQTAEMSLAAYIPADLSSFDGYAPHGMQGTIENLRNRAAKDGGADHASTDMRTSSLG